MSHGLESIVARTASLRLFEGVSVRVLHTPGTSDFALIHFGSEADPGVDGVPFRDGLVERGALEVFEVVPLRTDWFAGPDLAVACSLIAARCSKPAIAFGARMGGCGALQHGVAAGGGAVLALSPVIDREPDGRAGSMVASGVSRLSTLDASLPAAQGLVASDPRDAEARLHAALVRQRVPAVYAALPYAGRHVERALGTPGSAYIVFEAVLNGRPDRAARILRRNRWRVPDFLPGLAGACAERCHFRWADDIATAAIGLGFDTAMARQSRARARAALGRVRDALADLEQLIVRSPGNVAHWVRLSEAYAAMGETAAVTQTLQLGTETTGRFALCWRLFRWLRDTGRPSDARAVAEVARRFWPDHAAQIERGIRALPPRS